MSASYSHFFSRAEVRPASVRPATTYPAVLEQLAELHAFEAPYLLDRLLKEKLVDTREDAELLFREAKRYLVLVEACGHAHDVPVFSRRVDEVWHQFILFTAHYEAFCARFFGHYVHHDPNPSGSRRREMTRDSFASMYESLFGAVPDAWRDELSLRAGTRVIRADFGRPIAVRASAGIAELLWHVESPPRVLLRVGDHAESVLRFVVETGAFYVRELPGPIHDDERVAIGRALVARGVLRVAP